VEASASLALKRICCYRMIINLIKILPPKSPKMPRVKKALKLKMNIKTMEKDHMKINRNKKVKNRNKATKYSKRKRM